MPRRMSAMKSLLKLMGHNHNWSRYITTARKGVFYPFWNLNLWDRNPGPCASLTQIKGNSVPVLITSCGALAYLFFCTFFLYWINFGCLVWRWICLLKAFLCNAAPCSAFPQAPQVSLISGITYRNSPLAWSSKWVISVVKGVWGWKKKITWASRRMGWDGFRVPSQTNHSEIRFYSRLLFSRVHVHTGAARPLQS